MIEIWQKLLEQLEVRESDEGQQIWNAEQIQCFESETGIILPNDYKDFCQVFGTGMFGDYMRIYCPNIRHSNLFINSLKDDINSFADPISGEILDVVSLNNLLDSAFVFGDNHSADIVFWDLRTYSELDKCYDIYIANSDCFDGVYKIGRVFYEFVRDFCLGMKSYEVLPESMRPAPQELILTFYPFRCQFDDEIDEIDAWMQNRLIWQKNIASGVVFKMAQTYEAHGQLTEALLLHIQVLKNAGASNGEAIRLFKGLKRLQDALGEERFDTICQAADYPPEQLLIFNTIVNASLTGNVNIEQESERFEVRHLPDPDVEFQQVWQDFLQSVQEQLATESVSSTENYSTEYEQIQQEVRQTLQNFMQVTLNPATSDATPNATTSGLGELNQAWQTLEQSIDRLKEQYPPRQHLFDEPLKHLHLPPESNIARPDRSRATEERELRELEQAARENSLYAFFRYLRTFRGHSAPVYSVRFSPDGMTLASGSADGTIKLWDLSSRKQNRTLTGHTQAVISLAISPNGEVLASGSADSTIKLWNLSTGSEINTLVSHNSSVLSLAISPDGQTLFSGSADHTIKLWDLNTGEIKNTLSSHTQSVLCVAISPDGQTLASGSADSTLKLWNLVTGEEIYTFDDETLFVFALDFHPSGQMLVSVNGDKTIKLWNLSSFEVIRDIPTTETLISVTISPDGQTLAGTYGNLSIRVVCMWDLGTGKLINYFEGCDNYDNNVSVNHCRIVYSVAFSPDGKLLASGGEDATVKLWGIPPPLNIEPIL